MNDAKTRAIRIAIAVAIVAALTSVNNGSAAPDQTAITIATGRVGGVYYPVGGAVCKIVNDERRQHGITCTVDITDGSVGNINELRTGDAQLALAQSDWQHDAYEGSGPFGDRGAFKDLRTVFDVYVENFTVVTRPDSNIAEFADLKGKRVGMGQPGSGRRQTMDVVMNAYGWKPGDVIDVSNFKAANEAEALCDNEVDAIVYTIGHPNPIVREAVATCDAELVPVNEKIIDDLVAAHPFYISSVIPKGTYAGMNTDIRSLGLVAALLTSKSVDADVIYQVTKAFFENLDRLRAASPLFKSLTDKQMTSAGMTAPLHEGALKYFSEAGLR